MATTPGDAKRAHPELDWPRGRPATSAGCLSRRPVGVRLAFLEYPPSRAFGEVDDRSLSTELRRAARAQLGPRERERPALCVRTAAADIAADRHHGMPAALHASDAELAYGDRDSTGRGLHHLGVEVGNGRRHRTEVVLTGVARQVELDVRHGVLLVVITLQSSRVATPGHKTCHRQASRGSSR